MSQTADQIVVEVTALVDGYKQAMVQVANITINNMKAAEDAAKKGSGAIEKALETAAGRVPDLIKNLGEGQNALHLFLQEGAALAPAFGVWGTVLGGAAGAIDAVAAQLGLFETAAERSKTAQESFSTAVSAAGGAFSAGEKEAGTYAQSLSLVERGYISLAQTKLDVALRDQKKTLDDVGSAAAAAAQKVRGALLSYATNSSDPRWAEQLDKQIAPLREELRPLLDQLAKPGLNADQYGELGVRFETLRAKAAEFGISLDDVIRESGNGGTAALQYADTLKELQDYQQRVNELQQFWASLLRALGFTVPEATGHVNGLIGALDAYLGRLFQIKSAGGADVGGAAVAATRGARIQQLKDDAKYLDGTAEGNRKAAAAAQAARDGQVAYNEAVAGASGFFDTLGKQLLGIVDYYTAYDQSLINSANRERGAASARQSGTSTIARQQKAIDDSLQKMQQEADLNDRLIAAYRAGPAARERERAAYDAVNAARERGLKIGTQEYSQYVQQYQNAAERLRLSKLTLDDYAKGEQLTKSVETQDEQRLSTLAEYNRLRHEGAIADETYRRLLEKLNAENSGYVEGIRAIGQAIQGGIQGATSFSDALTKVGISLAQLLLQAALFGNGPLGKAFGHLTGLAGGLLGLGTGDGGMVFGETVADALTGTGGLYAQGGNPPLGVPSIVGEAGPELFVPRVPGTIIPTQMSQRLLSGRQAGSNQPITFNISMAGANGDRAIAEIAAAAVKKGLASVPEINRQHRIRFA